MSLHYTNDQNLLSFSAKAGGWRLARCLRTIPEIGELSHGLCTNIASNDGLILVQAKEPFTALS